MPKIEYRFHLPSILVVVAGYFSLFATSLGSLTVPELLGLTAAGIVYLAVVVYGFVYVEYKSTLVLSLTYLAFQSLLALGINFLSHSTGMVWLITLPLVSHGAVLLTRNWLLVACSLLTASFAVPVGLAMGPSIGLQVAIYYISAIVFVVVFTQVTLRESKARQDVELLAAQLSNANSKLREYAAQAEELATTKERNRLAREIHDSLGHYLTVANVQLEAARAVIDSDRSRSLDAITKAQKLVQDGLAEVRRSVAALRASPTDNRSLAESLNSLLDECRAAGIVAEMVVTGDQRPLIPQAELTLYRAAQEGLTNVRKHAHASQVGLTLEYTSAGTVRLAVKDNGVGAGVENGGGFGLLGVRERVQLLGGEARFSAASGKGFTLEVEIPE